MSSLAWPGDYVADDKSGLDKEVLLEAFRSSSGVHNLTDDEVEIVFSTMEATVWFYPLNETHRFYELDTVARASANKLFKPAFAASWLNKNSAPAPNSSLLYTTAWLDLSKLDSSDYGEQVLYLPSNPDDHYYVFAVLDSYINTVGSFGPRNPINGDSKSPALILIAGPESPYYDQAGATVVITDDTGNQNSMHVLQVDTPRAWVTARINANTLDAESMAATRSFINGSAEGAEKGFQLTSLSDFKANGTVPYASPITQTSSGAHVNAARLRWGNIPKSALRFFEQVDQALKLNPVPSMLEGKSNTTPASYQIWINNQNVNQDSSNSGNTYQPPSALDTDQKTDLNQRFAAIGLNLSTGFTKPSWSARTEEIFEKSYQAAQDLLRAATTELVKGEKDTNKGWNITNENIGVYPNNWESWLVRAGTAIDGGAANIPNDAVYPTTEIDQQGHSLTSTYNYKVTIPLFRPESDNHVEKNGPAQGFWSFTIYQPNPGNAYQPFLIENSISNTVYSPINSTATLTETGKLKTAKPGNWNSGTTEGTALITGSKVDIEGLDANTIYYVKSAEEVDDGMNLQLTLSSDYEPKFSTRGIPIGGSGSAGTAINITGTTNSSIDFGWINPVSQLGSNQQSGISTSDTTLQKKGSGSIELHLSSFAPQSNPENWLPTPRVVGSGSSHPKQASKFQVMARYYWPTTEGRSILNESAPELYLPPKVERLWLNRLETWNLLSETSQALVKAEDPTFGSTHPFDTPSTFNGDVVGALIDLRILPQTLNGQDATLNYSYSRNADYDNQLFFYAIDDLTGIVNGVLPSESGYLDTAWSNKLHPSTPIETSIGSIRKGTIELPIGQLYAPIVNNNEGLFFTAFDSANEGSYRHFDLLSGNSFAFEDLPNGGGEHDRNDGLFTIHSINL